MRRAAILRLAFAVVLVRSGLPQNIRTLNQRLDPIPTSRDGALRTIRERAAQLSELIESHPSEALAAALPPESRTDDTDLARNIRPPRISAVCLWDRRA